MLNEPYPSEGISRMLDEVNTLEPKVWLEKYAIFTDFEKMMQVTICTEYFKRSIPPLLLALRKEPERIEALTYETNAMAEEKAREEDERDDALAVEQPERAEALEKEKKERAERVAREKAERLGHLQKTKYEAAKALATVEAERLKEVAQLAGVTHNEMLYFEKQIRQRFIDQKYCFVALTKNRKERNYYDLQEDPASLRYITVTECGNQACKKREADGCTLQRCSLCDKAAYCERACQKADWKFHKRYCKSLASKKEMVVTATPGRQQCEKKETEIVEEVSDDEC